MDPYQILGVSRDASDEEITKAYRSAAKKYHPDIHPDDPLAAKKMSAVNNAYDEIQRQRSVQKNGTEWNPDAQSPRGDLSAAETLLSEGRPEEALRILQSLSERSARWHYLCAAAYANLGNRSIARQYIAAAVRMDPDNPDYRELDSILNHSQGSPTRSGGFLPLSWLWKGFVIYLVARWLFSWLLG
jgi:molecular chaperone DnaJ